MQGTSLMSAQQNTHFATLRFALLAVAALALAACTSGPSAGVPQEGALRTGTYPTFGVMPRGETKQLSFEEKDQIAGNLKSAKARQGHLEQPDQAALRLKRVNASCRPRPMQR